jgi:nitrate reductase NapE component
MERTRGEIISFVVIAFGVWLSIWGVILVSGCLEAISFVLTLGGLISLGIRSCNS